MNGEGGFDFSSILNKLSEMVSTWGLKVLGALVVLIVGLIVARSIRKAIRRGMARSKRVDESLIPFVSGIAYYLLLAALIIAVLQMFGVEATSMIAVLGAAGLAVGLALQGTLSNFAAGVMLLVFRPFKLGDFVEAGGMAGSVKEISIFSITLATPDNVKIIMPNSAVYGQTIKNYTANDTRRNDLVVGISYNDDIGKARDVILGILKAEKRVLEDPAPVVAVSELGDSSVNLVVRPWCKKEDYWDLRFDLTRKIKEELEAAGCSIPFPQNDVHLHQAGKAA
jgi:small conductance mechanosensitive channel